MFLSDEGPMLEMLDFTFYIGSTLYFEFNTDISKARYSTV